jgi:glycosyltransferase involved in cell wall biosynthesis
VRRFIERLAPDVVHINQQVAEDGLDLVLAARESGQPFVSTIHITQSATELSARFAWVRDSVTKYVLSRGGSKYIAVSAVTAKRLGCRMPCLDASSIPVVYYGVDDQDCKLIEKNRVQARRDWGLADDDVAVGAVGRIEEQKNPLFIVDIIADLVASNCNPRLVWIGDGALRPALKTRAFERGVVDRLIIDGWRDDACLRMAGLDIVAMPSRFEGLPLALLEAMHAGLAVCVSDADGMPEAVTDGRDGLIIPVSAPEAWREAIGGLVNNATVRGRLGAAARDTARARFSLEAMARATLAVYEQTIAETARRQRDALAG